jgi:hypothetical protein
MFPVVNILAVPSQVPADRGLGLQPVHTIDPALVAVVTQVKQRRAERTRSIPRPRPPTITGEDESEVGSALHLPLPGDHREVRDIVRHERQSVCLAGIEYRFIVEHLPAALKQRGRRQSPSSQANGNRRWVVVVKDQPHAEAAC